MKNQRGCLQNGGYYGSNVSVLAWLALLIEQIAVVRSPGFKMAATNGQTLKGYSTFGTFAACGHGRYIHPCTRMTVQSLYCDADTQDPPRMPELSSADVNCGFNTGQ